MQQSGGCPDALGQMAAPAVGQRPRSPSYRGQRQELGECLLRTHLRKDLGSAVELAIEPAGLDLRQFLGTIALTISAVTLRPSSSTPFGERIHCQTCEREISAVAASSIRLWIGTAAVACEPGAEVMDAHVDVHAQAGLGNRRFRLEVQGGPPRQR